mmetsp:Transcript_130263/g.278348  ORF Transcript_130263/g.278348 Transcript_130263/m.278348 type:complete len:312 (-) Transcript_130263:523-1458(-)
MPKLLPLRWSRSLVSKPMTLLRRRGKRPTKAWGSARIRDRDCGLGEVDVTSRVAIIKPCFSRKAMRRRASSRKTCLFKGKCLNARHRVSRSTMRATTKVTAFTVAVRWVPVSPSTPISPKQPPSPISVTRVGPTNTSTVPSMRKHICVPSSPSVIISAPAWKTLGSTTSMRCSTKSSSHFRSSSTCFKHSLLKTCVTCERWLLKMLPRRLTLPRRLPKLLCRLKTLPRRVLPPLGALLSEGEPCDMDFNTPMSGKARSPRLLRRRSTSEASKPMTLPRRCMLRTGTCGTALMFKRLLSVRFSRMREASVCP